MKAVLARSLIGAPTFQTVENIEENVFLRVCKFVEKGVWPFLLVSVFKQIKFG